MDWDVIKGIVAKNPDEVRDLVQGLSAPKLDTALTYNDRIIAFYGQALLTRNTERRFADEASRLFSREDYVNALANAKEALDINPPNITALDRAGRSIYALVEAGDTTYTKEEGKQYFNRAMRLFNTIATTGLGNKEYPFCITTVADEYEFMRSYLELYDIKSQALVGHCDVFTLGEGSQYFSSKELYFDATLPLESLKALGI